MRKFRKAMSELIAVTFTLALISLFMGVSVWAAKWILTVLEVI